MHVRNGRQADFKALLGLLELPLQGQLLGFRESNSINGGQHIEVPPRHAHQEILVGGLVGGVGLADPAPGDVHVFVIRPVVQRLAQAEVQVFLVGIGVRNHTEPRNAGF